jgi:DNA-directed RNA polymerase omega subunit
MTTGGSYIMAKAHEEIEDSTEPTQSQEIDSKYRLIILAAKRSKQLQRGARPRIEIDPTKHKPTRIALEEVIQGKVLFHTTHDVDEPQEKA